jgi:RNase P subunit RPR2
MAQKKIEVYCPVCEEVIHLLSIQLLKQVESVTVKCYICGHTEVYSYNEKTNSVVIEVHHNL